VPVRTLDGLGRWSSISSTLRLDRGTVSIVGANPLRPTLAGTTSSLQGGLVSIAPAGRPTTRQRARGRATPLRSGPGSCARSDPGQRPRASAVSFR
jgi:hypothetical protein